VHGATLTDAVFPQNLASYATRRLAGGVLFYNKKSFDMNAIPSSQKGDPDMELTALAGVQESIYPYGHEVNITEGGEFLDDAIRTKDQPLGEITVKANE
jgi:hypothetical protein